MLVTPSWLLVMGYHSPRALAILYLIIDLFFFFFNFLFLCNTGCCNLFFFISLTVRFCSFFQIWKFLIYCFCRYYYSSNFIILFFWNSDYVLEIIVPPMSPDISFRFSSLCFLACSLNNSEYTIFLSIIVSLVYFRLLFNQSVKILISGISSFISEAIVFFLK